MSQPRPNLPSVKRIMDYWRDWVWETHEDAPEDGFCWACGMIYEGGLERAHIQARCNGGADTVENLHLLCSVCHKVSEYLEGDDYWKWLEKWTFHDVNIYTALRSGHPVFHKFISVQHDSV